MDSYLSVQKDESAKYSSPINQTPASTHWTKQTYRSISLFSTKAVKVYFEKLAPTELRAHIYGLLFELFRPQKTFYFKKSLQSKTAVILFHLESLWKVVLARFV